MNARIYDAAIGRFLSPDSYTQFPDVAQGLNRYSWNRRKGGKEEKATA